MGTSNAAVMRASDPALGWGSAGLDLDAYLARIGYAGPLEPTAATLRALHRAHVLAIPFENADPAVGRPVALDLASLQDKLVRRRRGGYCYEQNLLFAAALERFGFTVTGQAARVRMGEARLRAASHALLRVDTGEGPWLADVGFGGSGLLEPMPLADGAEADQGGWRFRLDRAAEREWVLRSWRDGGWFDLYAFSPEPAYAVDYAVANYYVSTHPRSPFVGRLIVERISPDHRLSLDGGDLRVRHRDGQTVETVPPEWVPAVLRERLNLDLAPDEAAAVVELVRAKASG